MKAVTRITFFDDDQQKFFGEGPARLLHAVEETGSLRAAAISMGMAYTKALKILKNAEAALGFPLTRRTVGGKTGGGSTLTEEGRAWLSRYEAYRDACIAANGRLYQAFFPQENPLPLRLGCVVMASGEGRRFGGNKLMASFNGKPLIQWVLDATEGLFDRRVVVTRHHDVANLCASQGVPVLFHAQPLRSDTVRLGLQAVGDVDGCLFCPGDQPLLHRKTLQALIASAANDPQTIWRAAYGDAAGSPVLFPHWAFEELLHLPEGMGGGVIAKKHPEQVRTVPVGNAYELMDVDTPEDLSRLEQR